jgi:hypothetical protein
VKRGRAARAARGRGQALAEVLVALLLLVPLALAVIYVGRWHDLQHTTIAAARHAAFEAWVAAGRVDAAAVRQATRRRLYTREPDRFVATAGADAPVGQLPEWRDHAGRASLVGEPGPDVQLAPVAQPEEVARTEQLALGMIAPARAVGGPPFDLQRGAARAATVSVPVWHAPGLEAPFGGLRFTLRESLQLLVDPWASAGRSQVAARTDALSPVGALRDLARPLEPVRWALSLVEPAAARLCLGRIEPDVVPPDRLRAARAPALDLRTRPC